MLADTLWVCSKFHEGEPSASVHRSEEGALGAAMRDIDSYLPRLSFQDPGKADPYARIEAWNTYVHASLGDNTFFAVSEEPIQD